MDFLIGRRLGPYQLEGLLGSGGMGVVYRAVHRGLEVPRAVKILPMNLAADPIFVARFQREARLAVRLRHPNIVPVHDIGEADGIHYLAMELLEGSSLREVITVGRPLPITRALDLLRQLADALDYAHTNGVAHRDVKPTNAFVSPTGHLTLVDFGIARAAEESKLTSTGMIIGTAEYMAPEQAEGNGSGTSADLYALGIVAYEMLAGRVPFTGPNTLAILRQQLDATPPPPRSFRADIPPDMEQIVLRQLAKSPSDRFATGRAFVNALTNVATRSEPAASETTRVNRPPTVDVRPSQLADAQTGLTPPPHPAQPGSRPQPSTLGADPAAPSAPPLQASGMPQPAPLNSAATHPPTSPMAHAANPAAAQTRPAQRPVWRIWLGGVVLSSLLVVAMLALGERALLGLDYAVLVLMGIWIARVRRSFRAGMVATVLGGLVQFGGLLLFLAVFLFSDMGMSRGLEVAWNMTEQVARLAFVVVGCPTILAAIGIVLGGWARSYGLDTRLAWSIVLGAVGLLVFLTTAFMVRIV